jgi:dipeptidase D
MGTTADTDTQTSELPDALAGAEPAAFWARFAALTRIARPSRHEEQVIEYIRSWASGRGYELAQDSGRNLVIRVPATAGREDAPTVILQGHLDMVCERDPASPNDPAEGRIALVRDGEWLKADGTTLGADDGVAIAAMQALVEDETLPHGPLELLMTVAEEVGLEGANALDGSLLSPGAILINLDSEEDGRLTVGCAGSTDTWVRIDGERAPADDGAVALTVRVGGGLGGHSGSNIHLGRSNAIKVLGRVLREASAAVPFRLVSLQGGKSRNAIPRDAEAVVSVTGARETELRGALDAAAATVRDAFAKTDAGVDVTVESADAAGEPWTADATARMLDAIALVPTGPLAMSPDFDDLVETSTSLGEALTENGRLTLHSLSRSSNDSALPEVVSALDAAARLAGGRLDVKHNYPGWRPNLDSPALAAAKAAYERILGEPPIVTAVHAGLETAVIGGKVANLDMLSFGPQIEAPHSPDERVSVPTVERFWRLLVGVVDELSRPGAGR